MIKQVLGVAGLFLGYGTVGLAGDLVAEVLVDRDTPMTVDVRFEGPEVALDEAADPDVALDIDVDVRVGSSDRCAFTVDRTVQVAASAEETLRLYAGSGDLRVEGRAGLDQVRAVGRVCASHREYVDDLRLTLEREGGGVVLTAHYPDRGNRWRGGDRDQASIDLTVEVPLGMALDADDSSGGMSVRGTGDTRIDDSSGGITVESVVGSLTIDDSSGEIWVRDVAGDVSIDDGSGEIDVAGVGGVVRLQDGSGSMEVVDVERDVVVERDGSGSITVRDVRGDFSVLRDGSGGIRFSGISGRVDVPSDKRRGRRGN